MKNAKVKILSTAVALGLTMVHQSAYAADPSEYQRIGDLEIYKKAEKGKTTIMMMLDTSGSMIADATDITPCDFKEPVGKITTSIQQSTTTPRYNRTICTATQSATFRYGLFVPSGSNINNGTYYECSSANCLTFGGAIRGKPADLGNYTQDLIGHNLNIDGRIGSFYRYGRFRQLPIAKTNPDRLTRLKDALFKLLDKDSQGKYLLDPKDNIAIGLGQFSTQSDANNITGSPDGVTGKILVPARLLTEEQRTELKTVAAKLIGGSGTPSATAYAEAGAYMLGTTTEASGMTVFRDKYMRSGSGYLVCQKYAGPGCLSWVPGSISSISGLTLNSCVFSPGSQCYQEKITGTSTSLGVSGFYKSATATKNGSKYISPINNAASCDGQGIYFLTDGEPNSSIQPENLMKAALGNKASSFNHLTNTLPNGTQHNHGVPQIGAFAKALRNADQNPAGVSIRTAVVGFGSVFDVEGGTSTLQMPKLDKKTSLPIPGQFKDTSGTYFDCNKIPANRIDARNACWWGAKSHPNLPSNVGGYGEGGFYSAQSTQDVVDSVVNFLNDLGTTISASPSGTISVPADPLNALTIQPFAYLPMMQPNVADSSAIWQGNLRKYHTLYGTLYGKDGTTRLYQKAKKPTAGNGNFPSAINPKALDLWQTSNTEADSVNIGGARSHLVAENVDNEPNLTNKTSRVVYVEGGTVAAPKLVAIQVQNGKLKIDGSANNVANLTRYSLQDLEYLVDFLGFPIAKTTGTVNPPVSAANITALNTKIASTPMRSAPVFGGVNHSVPVLASYEGSYDQETGNVSIHPDKRKDYLLYGSMDGALHMTNAKTGQEQFAFIPRVMFDTQREALAEGAKNRDGKIGQPYFGVDAPWVTRASYDYGDSDKVVADGMMAYGGLRMGGVGFYGLDLAEPDAPILKFSISKTTPNFERLGQTWAKPTFTKIKTGAGVKDFKEVIVFGGGYDMCYENPKFKLDDANNTDASCKNKSQTEGNAIYMIDAKTGAFIARWQATNVVAGGVGASGDDRNKMKHSFVSEIVALDRNNNGYVDSLYASDLGGQLFRIDLKEGVSVSNMTRRVVRVFDANADANLGDAPPLRFYEKPLVSFYDHDGTLALVNISSGDRSSPLHTHRDTATKANRIYGIIDRDLPTFRIGQTGSEHLITRNLSNKHLHAYNTASIASMSNTARMELIQALQSKAGTPQDPLKDGAKQGWWYPMTRFENYTDVKHLKAIGSSVVMGGIYYTSIYSPDYQYSESDSCSARLVGATERQMFCLPWGICAADKESYDENGKKIAEPGALVGGSKNGTFGYDKAGPGIQEIGTATVTAEANKSTNFRTVIGMQTLAERIEDAKNSSSSAGGNQQKPALTEGSGVKGNSINDSLNAVSAGGQPGSKVILTVDRWYDLATAEANQ